MHTTHDIATPPAEETARRIADTKELADVIYEMARDQLILDAAAAKMQSTLEAAKKAYDEATRPITEKQAANLAAVEKFATEHRDTLFPLKGNKRTKTYNVLDHALKLRSSESIITPEGDADTIVDEAIKRWKRAPGARTDEEHKAMIDALLTLLNQQPPTWDKDQAKRLLKQPEGETIRQLTGLALQEQETFKVEFRFSPAAN